MAGEVLHSVWGNERRKEAPQRKFIADRLGKWARDGLLFAAQKSNLMNSAVVASIRHAAATGSAECFACMTRRSLELGARGHGQGSAACAHPPHDWLATAIKLHLHKRPSLTSAKSVGPTLFLAQAKPVPTMFSTLQGALITPFAP